jgi:glutathione peroxidase
MSNIYEFKVKDIKGNEISLSDYKGKTLLIVNVASKCGYTKQYKSLESLYLKYKDKGLVVMAFPCNQFGQQEPGTNEEVAQFCDLSFNVTFPLFSKIDVNGDNTIGLYNYLKESLPGVLGTKNIKWNFTKFLINKNGVAVKRYAPKDEPSDFESEVAKVL